MHQNNFRLLLAFCALKLHQTSNVQKKIVVRETGVVSVYKSHAGMYQLLSPLT